MEYVVGICVRWVWLVARVGASHQVLLTSVLQPAASRQQRAQHGGLVGGTKARYLVTSHTLWSPWNISVSQFWPHNSLVSLVLFTAMYICNCIILKVIQDVTQLSFGCSLLLWRKCFTMTGWKERLENTNHQSKVQHSSSIFCKTKKY